MELRSVVAIVGSLNAAGLFARIVSREALILMKQEAGRAQDLVDIEELLRVERLTNENA